MNVETLPLEPGSWSVTIREGDVETVHRLVLDDATPVADDLLEIPEERIVREFVAAMLDRVPSTSLPHDIDVGDALRREPGLADEVATRLGV